MDGYKLILNSLLVPMELSTNSPAQNLSFFVGYLADLPWNSWEHGKIMENPPFHGGFCCWDWSILGLQWNRSDLEFTVVAGAPYPNL